MPRCARLLPAHRHAPHRNPSSVRGVWRFLPDKTPGHRYIFKISQKCCPLTRWRVWVCVYTQSMTTTAATTYTATLPNGETVTRKSKRTYTHFYAKKLKPEITDTAAVKNVGTDWFFGGFSSSQAHAEKAAAATSWGMFDWVVLEVSAQP